MNDINVSWGALTEVASDTVDTYLKYAPDSFTVDQKLKYAELCVAEFSATARVVAAQKIRLASAIRDGAETMRG